MRKTTAAAAFALLLSIVHPAWAGITVYEKDDKKVEIGGRIQLEYVGVDPNCSAGVACLENDSGDTFDSYTDEMFFRRLRPYIAGTVSKNWMGKIEFDFGESLDSNEVQVKDAYFAFSGFKNDHSKLYIGNAKTVFGRELLNSSSSLVLVERGFVGDHNFGVPDRALGVRFDSRVLDGKISYQLSAGAEQHDPGVNRVDFDSVVNNATDWNEGVVVAGRIDFHPLGYMKISQGNFGRGKSKFTIGLSMFAWRNDNDNNTYTDGSGGSLNPDRADLDQATGGELSAAYRGHGVTVDAVIQRVSADTVVKDFTGGVYLNGSTDLDKFSLIGSYLFAKDFLEIVLGWQQQDASNYQDKFTRTSAGVNFYFKGNNIKLQLEYQDTRNFIGISGQDQGVYFVSTQFMF